MKRDEARRSTSRARAAFFALTVAATAAGAFGCATARRGAPLAAPVEPSSPDSRKGRLTFARSCYACHGHGEGGLAPAINDKTLPAFMVRLQVRQGLGAMPPFDADEIPDPALEDLIAYLGDLRRSERP